MKHSPFCTWKSGDLICAVPFFDSAIHQWNCEYEDLDDEIGFISPQEHINSHEEDDLEEERHFGHFSVIRTM